MLAILQIEVFMLNQTPYQIFKPQNFTFSLATRCTEERGTTARGLELLNFPADVLARLLISGVKSSSIFPYAIFCGRIMGSTKSSCVFVLFWFITTFFVIRGYP